MRKSVILAAALLGAMLIMAACAPAAPALGTAGNPIKMVFVPSGETEEILAGAGQLETLLEAETGLQFESSVATTYVAAVEAMCAGEAHIGWLATFSYLYAKERGCADVSMVTVRFGTTSYGAQLVAHADSGIDSFAALNTASESADFVFCRPSPTSTSGWIIPSLFLRAEGIDVAAWEAEGKIVDATGGHNGVIILTHDGECTAGSTFIDARGSVADDPGYEDTMEVVIAWFQSDPIIPNDTFSFTPTFPGDIRETIVTAMLDIAQTEEGVAALEAIYEIGGWERKDDTFFDQFRALLEASGVDVLSLVQG